MSNEVAIRVEGLSKKYYIGGKQERYRTLRDTLTDAFVSPFRRVGKLLRRDFSPFTSHFSPDETIWALKNVSFEVKQGEVVGIIGRNGAGKSTLLKILSRITEPTEGYADIHGRVGSLLEVGTGFHAELTGRENIYLNGAILGMKKAEIDKKFDEIVAFAEVEKFIDTPVKHYSTGMYLRLAFAVAAHLEPEILLVDEVLAVGDAQFQKKCLGKMEEVGKEGRTVLFVSHNMTALQRLCEKAILFDAGRMLKIGEAGSVVSIYQQKGATLQLEKSWNDPEIAPGNDKIRFHKVKISSDDGLETSIMTTQTPVKIIFEYWNFLQDAQLNLSVVLYDQQDVCVFNTVSEPKLYPIGKVRGICHIPGNLLNNSTYRVRVLIVKNSSIPLIDIDNIAAFEIQEGERIGNWYGKWIGTVRPKLQWETETIESIIEPDVRQ